MKSNVSRLKRGGDLIALFWNELPEGGTVPTFRKSDHTFLDAPTDYCDYVYENNRLRGKLSKSKSLKSAMDPAAYTLRWFFAFLIARSIDWMNVTDEILADFRDWAYKQTRLDERSRDEWSARRTTNVKLHVIYTFYCWAVEEARLLPESTFGPRNCAITSTLLHTQHVDFHDPRDEEHLYPLCFKKVGEGSRTKGGQYWATTRDLGLLEEHFWYCHGDAVAARDALILAIGDSMGWRIESINSLVVQDFAQELIDEAEAAGDAGLLVRPAKQKFGYAKPFEVPWPLVYRIRSYIEQDRAAIIKSCGVTEKDAEYRVFLSATEGTPLTDGTLVKEFSGAFRAIGAKKGAGTHSLRRKFAEDVIREEIEFRIRSGLSTARENVIPAVAERLGHNSDIAQSAYIRVTRNMRLKSIEQELKDKANEDAATIAALRAENSALRRQAVETTKRQTPPKGKNPR